MLDSIANSTTSIEQAEEVEALAEQKSLEAVRQHALEKQAALTTDPVNRLQLRYRLVQLYENRKDFRRPKGTSKPCTARTPKFWEWFAPPWIFTGASRVPAGASLFCCKASNGRISGLEQAVRLRSGAQVNRGRTISRRREIFDQTAERVSLRWPISRGDGRYLRPGWR